MGQALSASAPVLRRQARSNLDGLTMTIRDALRAARQLIDPLDAHVLLGDILGVDRAYLIANPDAILTPEQTVGFAKCMARCAAGEPVAYILGRRAFYD